MKQILFRKFLGAQLGNTLSEFYETSRLSIVLLYNMEVYVRKWYEKFQQITLHGVDLF